MSLEQALADLKAATTAEHLGREHLLDGVVVVCVVRSLNEKEAQAFSAEGMLVEGIKIVFANDLPIGKSHVGGVLNVDGINYDIRQKDSIGELSRITCTRYLG